MSGERETVVVTGSSGLIEVNHFAAEMDHFSECVAADRPPRTPGEEGLADVRVIEAIAEAARTERAVAVKR